jgi:hypothetical protein
MTGDDSWDAFGFRCPEAKSAAVPAVTTGTNFEIERTLDIYYDSGVVPVRQFSWRSRG